MVDPCIRTGVVAALAILASCGSRPGGNQSAAVGGPDAAANAVAAGDNAAGAKPPGGALGPAAERWVGRWSADGNCEHFMVLGRDGSYVDYLGIRGTWRPEGSGFLIYMGPEPIPVYPDGLTRC